MTFTLVAGLLALPVSLPLVIGGTLSFHCIGELYVRCKGAQVVYDIVDTKVVSMLGAADGFLVQCDLTYTVNGVVGIVNLGGHTVTCTLHNHTASEHAQIIGTLYSVHHTAGVDTADTCYNETCLFFGGQVIVLFGCYYCALVVFSLYCGSTLVFQLEVCSFTVVQLDVIRIIDTLGKTVVVSTVIGYVKFAVSVHEC